MYNVGSPVPTLKNPNVTTTIHCNEALLPVKIRVIPLEISLENDLFCTMWQIPSRIDFISFSKYIFRICKLPIRPSNPVIKWVDPDGDECTLYGNLELAEMVRLNLVRSLKNETTTSTHNSVKPQTRLSPPTAVKTESFLTRQMHTGTPITIKLINRRQTLNNNRAIKGHHNNVTEESSDKNPTPGSILQSPAKQKKARKLHVVANHYFQCSHFNNRNIACTVCGKRIWAVGFNWYQCIICRLFVHKKCHRFVKNSCELWQANWAEKVTSKNRDTSKINESPSRLTRQLKTAPHYLVNDSNTMDNPCADTVSQAQPKPLVISSDVVWSFRQNLHNTRPQTLSIRSRHSKRKTFHSQSPSMSTRSCSTYSLESSAHLNRESSICTTESCRQLCSTTNPLKSTMSIDSVHDSDRYCRSSSIPIMQTGCGSIQSISPFKDETNHNRVGISSLSASPIVPPQPSPLYENAPRSRVRSAPIFDFNVLNLIGRGSYAKVFKVCEQQTTNTYAMKVIKKSVLCNSDGDYEWVLTERHVFSHVKGHPFLVDLYCAFQTDEHVIFLTEFVSGGDLMFHMQRLKCLAEEHACFYVAEIAIALNYLHCRGILYRDLKLDNVLIDVSGHIKITDYGMCKENLPLGGKTTTFCGTPNYIAPEMLTGTPYGISVDYWALGVLTFEMLVGKSPFSQSAAVEAACDADKETEDLLFQVILEQPVRLPRNLSKRASLFIKSLLEKEPQYRLGCNPANDPRLAFKEFKEHPFFRFMNFQQIIEFKIEPPFYPLMSNRINGLLDVSCFDEQFTKAPIQLTPENSIRSERGQRAMDLLTAELLIDFPYYTSTLTQDMFSGNVTSSYQQSKREQNQWTSIHRDHNFKQAVSENVIYV